MGAMIRPHESHNLPSVTVLNDINLELRDGDWLGLAGQNGAGMIVRLTFAITIAVTPETMLMDERLGAGAARFAKKARHRVDDFVSRCSIMVVASQAPSLIKEMCNQTALLSHGRPVARGTTDDILKLYDDINNAER
jgi:ABC-2 type transport system ATP-binding protein